MDRLEDAFNVAKKEFYCSCARTFYQLKEISHLEEPNCTLDLGFEGAPFILPPLKTGEELGERSFRSETDLNIDDEPIVPLTKAEELVGLARKRRPAWSRRSLHGEEEEESDKMLAAGAADRMATHRG